MFRTYGDEPMVKTYLAGGLAAPSDSLAVAEECMVSEDQTLKWLQLLVEGRRQVKKQISELPQRVNLEERELPSWFSTC